MPPKEVKELDPTKYRDAIYRAQQPRDTLSSELMEEMLSNPPPQAFWQNSLTADQNLLSCALWHWPIFFFFLFFNPRLDFLVSDRGNHYTILIEYFRIVSEAPLYLAKLLMLYGATLEGEQICAITKKATLNLQAYKTWFNSPVAIPWKGAQTKKMQVDDAMQERQFDPLRRHPLLLSWLNDYSALITQEEILFHEEAGADSLALWPKVIQCYHYNHYSYLLQFLENIQGHIEIFQTQPKLPTFPELPTFPFWLNWPDTTKPLLEQLLPIYLATGKEDWISVVNFCLTNFPHLVDEKDKTCLLSYLAIVCSLHSEVLTEPVQTHLQTVFANHPGNVCLQLQSCKTVSSAASSANISSRNSTETESSMRPSSRRSSIIVYPADVLFPFVPLGEEASTSSSAATPPLHREDSSFSEKESLKLATDKDSEPLLRHRRPAPSGGAHETE